MKDGTTLVNFSNLPWVPGRMKRNQAIFHHLLTGGDRFAAGIFVSPPVVASAPAKYKPQARLRVQTTELAGKPLTLIEPVYGLPDWHLGTFTDRWARQISKDLIGSILSTRSYWLWMNSAGKLQHRLSRLLSSRATLRVFDSSDDFTAWERPEYHQQLADLVALSDKLLCVNDHVATLFDHPDKQVFRNCTDFQNFQTRTSFELLPHFPKPPGETYIGFTGGINSSRADEALLTQLFTRFPQWKFLFVGYTDDPAFVKRLVAHPNVIFVPEQPYKHLPHLIRAFDVAIVPHVDNACTRGNDLLKVLDYMACGVPIVSTPCSNVHEYGRAVHIAQDAEEFSACLDGLIAGRISHDPGPGFRIAQERSWKRSVPELLPWLTSSKTVLAGSRI